MQILIYKSIEARRLLKNKKKLLKFYDLILLDILYQLRAKIEENSEEVASIIKSNSYPRYFPEILFPDSSF